MYKYLLFFFLLSIGIQQECAGVVSKVPPCFKKMQVNFFERAIVEKALNLHLVSQSSWALINKNLNRRSSVVPIQMETIAKRMRPNPLSPFDIEEANKLLIEILFTIFRNTMIEMNFSSESGIREMFLFIQSHQPDIKTLCGVADKKSS